MTTARHRKGLVLVFTGDGKGKTTAAIGLSVRAAGHGMRVRIIQFIKGSWRTGEQATLRRLAPEIELTRAGRGFTIERLRDARISDEEHGTAARAGFEEARDVVAAGAVDVVVLDEILGAITADLISLPEVLALIAAKPPMLHLILTGRDAPAAIIDAADLVTEMRLVKHPFTAGVVAQKGVEF
ncbi:MAG: cob(I)yrinic acid a,c-diamide adenosyltransferase [Chloroflexi bacterium]|nr:cob(I)yrinic acid a,c-diamide adenosyltransferase [Chloroflexota bacterium]